MPKQKPSQRWRYQRHPRGALLLGHVAQCVAAAVLYGIVHDQITARISRRYFTLYHPSLGIPWIFHSGSTTVLAIAWGIVATAPLAFVLGVLVALCAVAGRWPPLSPRQMRWPLLLALCGMGLAAASAGCAAWLLLRHGNRQSGPLPGAPMRTVAVLWVHRTSYAAGALAALVLCCWAVARRHGLARKGAAENVAGEMAAG